MSGVGGTLTLTGTGFRKGLNQLGLIRRTAPQQIVDRLGGLGLLEGWGRGGRRALMIAAHYGYGTGAGSALGLLRRERGGLAPEIAVGAALGVLSWGVGWTTWLPIVEVQDAPWNWKSPKVLLPVLDHAVFGAFWGVTNWALKRSTQEGWV